jgi:hypothetical protein
MGAVDEEPSRELGPFAVLRRVLFEPEVVVLVRESAQASVSNSAMLASPSSIMNST